MRMGMLLSGALLALSSVTATGQPCPPTPKNAGATAWFSHEIDGAAQFVPDSTLFPFPDPSLNETRPFSADFALAQFVVDSTGLVRPSSLSMLVHPAALSLDAVQAILPRWRFHPATVGSCKVPQIVMVALRWKRAP